MIDMNMAVMQRGLREEAKGAEEMVCRIAFGGLEVDINVPVCQ